MNEYGFGAPDSTSPYEIPGDLLALIEAQGEAGLRDYERDHRTRYYDLRDEVKK